MWVLGVFSVVAISWILSYFKFLEKVTVKINKLWSSFSYTTVELVTTLWCIFFITFVTVSTFKERPHLIDAVVQLFQAKIFSLGLVKVPAPVLSGFFSTQHMLFDEGQWYSQYPPGQSIIEAIGYSIGCAWMPCLILSVWSVLLTARFTKNVFGAKTAKLTLLLFWFCSFYFFMSGSFMNHIAAMFFAALLLWSFERWITLKSSFYTALCGISLGFGCTVRPLEFIAIAIVLVLVTLFQNRNAIKLLSFPSALLGAVLGVSPYLLFNKETTGSFLLPGYVKLWGSNHELGFHATPWGETHTFLRGVINQLININLLNEYLFDGCVPVLLVLAVALLAKKLSNKWDKVLLSLFFSVPFIYIFYWHRDSFLGPRYLYVILPFIIPLLARSLSEISKLVEGTYFGKEGIIKPVKGTSFISFLFLLSIFYSVCLGIPRREALYEGGLQSFKRNIQKEATNAGIEKGIIFIPISWGGRIISNLREREVPASLTEVAYRTVDHCELQELLLRSFSGQLSTQQLINEIEQKVKSNQPVQKNGSLNGDPTLRLIPEQMLTQSCEDEIKYDQNGYTIYEPHLSDNDPLLTSRLIFARDLHTRNQELLKYFPTYAAYIATSSGFKQIK